MTPTPPPDRPRHGSLERSLRRRDTRVALLMLLPAAVLGGVFMLYPIVSTFWMSLNQVNQFAFTAPTSPNTQAQIAARVGFQLRRSQRFGT